MQSKIKNPKSKIQNPLPALILAAGASSRMGGGGQPKQLLLYKNRSLLAHTIQTVQAAGFSPILVILGHDPTGAIQKEAHAAGVQTVHNPDWQKGLGTTIRAGLATLFNLPVSTFSHSSFNFDSSFIIPHPSFPALLLMLCDQPFLTPQHLIQLRDLATPDNLVAAAYNNTIGPPVIIGKTFFPELANIPDNQGAKQLLLRHEDSLIRIPLPEAATDIDTSDQFSSLQNQLPK